MRSKKTTMKMVGRDIHKHQNYSYEGPIERKLLWGSNNLKEFWYNNSKRKKKKLMCGHWE